MKGLVLHESNLCLVYEGQRNALHNYLVLIRAFENFCSSERRVTKHYELQKNELEVMENNNCCSLRLLCTHESIRRLSTRLSFRYISSRLPTRAMGHVPFQPPVLCHQVEPVEQFWPSHSFQYGPSLTVL